MSVYEKVYMGISISVYEKRLISHFLQAAPAAAAAAAAAGLAAAGRRLQPLPCNRQACSRHRLPPAYRWSPKPGLPLTGGALAYRLPGPYRLP